MFQWVTMALCEDLHQWLRVVVIPHVKTLLSLICKQGPWSSLHRTHRSTCLCHPSMGIKGVHQCAQPSVKTSITSTACKQFHSCMRTAVSLSTGPTEANFTDWRWKYTPDCVTEWPMKPKASSVFWGDSTACAAPCSSSIHLESSVTTLHCPISDWRISEEGYQGKFPLGDVPSQCCRLPRRSTWHSYCQITSWQTSPGQLLHSDQGKGSSKNLCYWQGS